MRVARLAYRLWSMMDDEMHPSTFVNPSGWSILARCANPMAWPPTHWNGATAPNSTVIKNLVENCTALQARPANTTIPDKYRSAIGWAFTHFAGVSPRGQQVIGYTRPVAGPNVVPRWRPVIPPLPFPLGDPEALPIKRPVQTPRPMPIWPGIRPPAPRDRPEPPLAMARSPVRNGSPAMGVRQGRRPAVGVSTGTAPREPSGPRERERKFLASPLLMAVLRAYEGLTELDDFVDAIWESIPKKLRTKGQRVGMAQKLLDIYNNADSISITDAVANLMANAIEDAIVGRLQGAAGKALRDMQLSPRSQSASDVMLMPRGRNFSPSERSQ